MNQYIDLLSPKIERNGEWLEKDIMILDDKDGIGSAHDWMNDSQGELDLQFDFGSSRDRNYLLEEIDWGSKLDVMDMKMLEACKFESADSSYEYQSREPPLFHDLKCRLYVNRRYYKAVVDYLNEAEERKILDMPFARDSNPGCVTANEEKCGPSSTPLDSLAEVGSKVALSFAFSFLRRAWRSSEDSELCTDLLQDTLTAFRVLPPASMFDTSKMSKTWLHVLQRSTDFLKSVATGELTGSRESDASATNSCSIIPVSDQNLAIELMLEIAFKKGNLPDLLEALLFLLNLWESRKQTPDSRKNSQRTYGPLLPFLKMIRTHITAPIDVIHDLDPNNILLSTIHFPEKDDIQLDFQQTVVITMSFLNRLALKHLNRNQISPLDTGKNNIFERKFAGPACYKLFLWSSPDFMYTPPELRAVHFKQVECGSCFCVGLSEEGVLYVLGKFVEWSSDGLTQSGSDNFKIVKFSAQDGKFQKISMHIKETYFLALSDKGVVYICGHARNAPFSIKSGREFFAKPEKIHEVLPWENFEEIGDITCSLDYIAVISQYGQVLTWNRHNLGKNDGPELLELDEEYFVKEFSACKVNDKYAAILSYDNTIFTLSVEVGGVLVCKENLEFGITLEVPRTKRLERVYAGENFTATISEYGELFIWGTGLTGIDGETIGPDRPLILVNTPSKVKDVAWDGLVFYVILEDGKVLFWQKGSCNRLQPMKLFSDRKIFGLSFGSIFNSAWGIDRSGESKLPPILPFVLQPTQHTLQLLDKFLTKACTSMDLTWPPTQEHECMVVATLNLLKLQFQESVYRCRTSKQNQNTRLDLLDRDKKWPCINNLKKNVLFLAGTPGVTYSMQNAAQKCLNVGWRILLPSVTERAIALTRVLEKSLEKEKSHQSQTFLINSLLESLIVGDGVEELVKQATLNTSSEQQESDDAVNKDGENIALSEEANLIKILGLILIKYRCRTIALLKEMRYSEDVKMEENDKIVFDFFIKFQTVVTAYALDYKNELMPACVIILKHYAMHMCDHVMAILNEAHNLFLEPVNKYLNKKEENAARFFHASQCLATDVGCSVLSPLITSLFLTQIEHGEECLLFCEEVDSGFVADFAPIKQLTKLLKALDQFNLFAPACLDEDGFALSADGIRFCNKVPDPSSDIEDSLPNLRIEDLENNKIDGGHWVVIDGRVYDVEQCDDDDDECLDKDSESHDSDHPKPGHKLVGKYMAPEIDVARPFPFFHKESKVSDFAVATRTLAVFIATTLSEFQKHKMARKMLKIVPESIRPLLKNGLESEKSRIDDENVLIPENARVFLKGIELHPVTKRFLLTLSSCQQSGLPSSGLKRADEDDDQRQTAHHFLNKFDHVCKRYGHFPGQSDSKSPLDQFGRCFIACLLKHHDLADAALTCSFNKHSKLPHSISELCHAVGKAKLKLINEHQSTGRTYDEICGPLIDRLFFLLTEVAPPTPPLLESLLEKIWRPKSRWKIAFEKWKKQKEKCTSKQKHDPKSPSAKLKDGDTDEVAEGPKFIKTYEKSVKKDKKRDFWRMIYDVVASRKRTKLLGHRINGTLGLDDNVTTAVTDFAFNKDLTPHGLRRALLYCQHSVKNSTNALQEIVEIFSLNFSVISTTYSLRTSWNGLFNNIDSGLPAKAVENSVIEEAERKRKFEEMHNDPNRYNYPHRELSKIELSVKVDQRIPCDPLLDLSYKEARNHFKHWAIGQFHKSAQDLFSMVKNMKKFSLASVQPLGEPTLEQQMLLSQTRLLYIETHALHFGWIAEDNNTTQCILSGCQAVLEKVFVALSEYGVVDPVDPPEKKDIFEFDGLDIASIGRKSGSIKTAVKVRHSQLETGPKLVEAMRWGTKVVRGRDWKWQDQDGKPPGEGEVITSPEDGWVRVSWKSSGITNSYRMGKDDKYDVKLAYPEKFCSEDTEDHTECRALLPSLKDTHQSYSPRTPLFPVNAMQRACNAGIEIQCLAMARLGIVDEGATRIVSKRIFNVLKQGNKHPIHDKGDWHSFQFVRALIMANEELSPFFATKDWIDLILDFVGHDYCTVTEGEITEQIQALKLLAVLLCSSHNKTLMDNCDLYLNYLFKTLGLLAIGLKLQDPLDWASKNAFLKRNPRLPGISRFADHAGTAAEAIIELLRNLHAHCGWKDTIGEKIFEYLQLVPNFMSSDMKNYKESDGDNDDMALAFGTLAMISQVDKRIRIGGNIEHVPNEKSHSWIKPEPRGRGIMTTFVSKDGKKKLAGFYVRPNGVHEVLQAAPDDIHPRPPTRKFDWESLPWSNSLVSTCNELLKIALSSPSDFFDRSKTGNCRSVESGAKPKNSSFVGYDHTQSHEKQMEICKVHMYIYVLRALPVLLQNQTVLRSTLRFSPPKHKLTHANASDDNEQNEEVPLSSSCPVTPTISEKSQLKKMASDGQLDIEKKETDHLSLLPLPDITVHEASVVDDYNSAENDSHESDDVTEVTEEYCSENDEGSVEDPRSYSTDDQNCQDGRDKNTLQKLLSLSICPSHLKPQFKASEMEEAVSALLLFIESSSDQQDILIDCFKKLNIQSSILEVAGHDEPGENIDEKHQSRTGSSKQNRAERRTRQIRQIRANENLHNPFFRIRTRGKPGREDSNKNCTSPRIPRWTPFPAEPLSFSVKQRDWESLVPSESMQILKDMGFKENHIMCAYRELSKQPIHPLQRDLAEGGIVPDMESVVAWLLENPQAYEPEPSTSDSDEDLDGFTVIENDIFGRDEFLSLEAVLHGLDGSDEDDSSSSDSDSSSDDDVVIRPPNRSPRPISASPRETHESQPTFTFLTPTDFATQEEYACYVRDNIKVGMMVKCCLSYEDVKEGDTGKVLKLDHDGLHDLNVNAAWVSKGGTYWVRYVHIQLVRDDSKPLSQGEALSLLSPISVGDRVRVKSSVSTPKYKWGSVRHSSVGVVRSISGKDAIVNFEQQERWTGLLSELEKVPEPHPRITCDQCRMCPIVGPRFKCTICYNYNMCSKCFGKKRHASPRHVFDMIEMPGSSRVRTTASIPPTAVRQRTLSTLHIQDVAFSPAAEAKAAKRLSRSAERSAENYDDNTRAEGRSDAQTPVGGHKLTTSWEKLVEKLEASSGDDTVDCLLDGKDETFWKSTGSVGEHKLMLHMRPGAVVTSLIMQVDPDDSSYMPSLVKIVLTSPDSKKVKSRAIRIQPTAKRILLLRDCEKHYSLITINIQKCKTFGIDCKVHCLFMRGYLLPSKCASSTHGKINAARQKSKKSDDEKIMQLFLASDSRMSKMTHPQLGEKSGGRASKCAGNTKVFAWGLNDKDQLGGPKGSKVKAPTFSERISSLKVAQVAGGSKSLFIVTQEGKVFACGESTSGRLGLGLVSSNVPSPTYISHISSYFIKKVAVHSGGRHAMALSSTGVVFSWGDGEDGKLGHSNRADCLKPRLIEALKEQHIIDIACGSSHSAAVTVTGQLYTWGQGNYGRLGHGDNNTQLKPKLVAGLQGLHVVKVACGSRDAQTLCLCKNEDVYSWGDGDFGKLGRGGSDGCATPVIIEKLKGKGIIQVECGAQFSLALSKTGKVWTWGKGDYFRLGQGHDSHVRYPTIISELQRKKIIKVAVGALHCLAITDEGEVFSWGDNDHGQQGNSTLSVNRKPGLVESLSGLKITDAACGSSHSIAWSVTDETQSVGFEPLRFPNTEDKLGSLYSPHGELNKEEAPKRSLLHLAGGYYRPKEEKKRSEDDEEDTPCLAKMALSVHSLENKKTALKTILQSLQILFARDLVAHSLIPSKFTNDDRNITYVESKVSIPTICNDAQEASASPVSDEECLAHSNVVAEDVSEDTEVLSSSMKDSQSTDPGPSTSNSTSSLLPKHKSSDLAMVSLIAETITTTEEITLPTPKKITKADNDGIAEELLVQDGNCLRTVSDVEIWKELGLPDATKLAEMLKLSVAGRLPMKDLVAVTHALHHLVKAHPKMTKVLLSLCLAELQEVAVEGESKSFEMRPVMQESTHPYRDDSDINGVVKIPGAKGLRIEFDSECSTETRHDVLSLYTDGRKTLIAQLSGRDQGDWSKVINVEGDELSWTFRSDASVNGWGWKFIAYPVCSMGECSQNDLDKMPDGSVLCKPLIAFVSQVLELIFPQQKSPLLSENVLSDLFETKSGVLHRLVSSLASCTHTSLIGPEMRIWAIQQLQNIRFHLSNFSLSKIFKPLTSALPDVLSTQYKYENPHVSAGKQLMYSAYLRELLSLASDLDLESVAQKENRHKLAPFSAYFLTMKVLDALIKRQPFPVHFLQCVSLKLDDLIGDDFDELQAYMPAHEDNSLFTQEMDEQLVNWMNSCPSDWTRTWVGSGQIFGWGHNHRGQLGGIDGAKVKVPVLCSTLVSLKPVSLAGGEQTLYAITADGKVYATGYGASGRLGIGSSDSIALPALLESIRHVHITKVSVNSGGKHILAISADNEVYSWGEGGDGKLGHGSRTSCDRPRVIESLRGVDIIDISAGGAHSAAISSTGRLYTWGKGRYGRLGHGDSEDRLKPKLVEALEPYPVRCVACGSGDAQTLCVTDCTRRDASLEIDGTTVWSWGDGDYGKLGRGGSEMSKVPMQIDVLKKKHIISVKCGSQFSLALSRNGTVYTWGKGDYFRLGHGSDQHIRFPKIVEDLRGKKVVDVSTGSLHCVVCTEDGEVYAWGDNDEGQIGDGTTQAAKSLTLVKSLSGQGIDRVACGSAHTVAWSTGSVRSRRTTGTQSRLPSFVPLKYNLLQALPIPILRNRLVLLNQFSEIFCGCIPLLPLLDKSWRGASCSAMNSNFTSNFDTIVSSPRFPDAVRGLLVNSGKECFFRKVVQTTMVRDKQHGPIIELNRIEVKDIKKTGVPLTGYDFLRAVFPQASHNIERLLPDSVLLPHRVWKVKFVGESVDDCGGGYSESIAEMCDELENGSVPLLMQTPNGRDEAGANRDCFLLLPPGSDPNNSVNLDTTIHHMFKFLGVLIGIAIRTGSPLSLNLAGPVWKMLSGQDQCLTDISEVDKDFLPKLMFIRDADAEELDSMNLPYTIQAASGKEVTLSMLHSTVTVANRNEFIRQAIHFRLHEFSHIVDFVRDGIACVVPLPLLSLFTSNEMETMVCGSPDIPLSLLKSVSSFKGTSDDDKLQTWFWEIMEAMTNEEKCLFLRFVWGRTRLPRTIADFRGRDFVIQVLDKYHPPDEYLPESYTCFFLLKLPRYSSKAIMDEKLKYAIYFCKSIDTDDYARLPTDADEDDDYLEDLISNNNSALESLSAASGAISLRSTMERLRTQVRTTHLNLLSRYSSNVSRFLRRRVRSSDDRSSWLYDHESNPDDDSSTGGPDSISDTDSDSVQVM